MLHGMVIFTYISPRMWPFLTLFVGKSIHSAHLGREEGGRVATRDTRKHPGPFEFRTSGSIKLLASTRWGPKAGYFSRVKFHPRLTHLFLAIYRGYPFQAIYKDRQKGPVLYRAICISMYLFQLVLFFKKYVNVRIHQADVRFSAKTLHAHWKPNIFALWIGSTPAPWFTVEAHNLFI